MSPLVATCPQRYGIRLQVGHINFTAPVGEKKWEEEVSVFCKPFTAAKVCFFDRAAIDCARAWLVQAGAAHC